MRTINPVIQLAKERALFRFTALVHPMLKDAINVVNIALDASKYEGNDKALAAALLFLRQDDAIFLQRIESVFAVLLERAMVTMYHDDRVTINQVGALELTLIDEKIVHEQIEVDRLLQRLRKADDADITKINIIIAQLHNQIDVKERENPFRPYLIAKTLYDVLREMVEDRTVSTMLLEYLASALANHLVEYYSAVRDVFEANGVRAKLSARPSRAFRQLRIGDDADGVAETPAKPRILSGLQRMQTYSQQSDRSHDGTGDNGQISSHHSDHVEELLSFVKRLFDQPSVNASDTGLSLQAIASDGQDGIGQSSSNQAVFDKSMELIAKLTQMQKSAAETHVFHEIELTAKNQLFSVSEQIPASETTPKERTTIDVVAMLFEFILEDEQIPATVRGQLARLQIPFLKAAMLAPEMLHNAQYPARVLLNRMSSSAIGLDMATPMGSKLSEEMTRVVTKILQEFDNNLGLFDVCLADLEYFLAENLRNVDVQFALSVDALEAAEKNSAPKKHFGVPLQGLLEPLLLDPRVNNFIAHIWRRVMSKEAGDRKLKEQLRFRAVLPELVWSVQRKRSFERAELMRLLPELVANLKAGLSSIHLPETESQVALDQFVDLHMDVLRAQQKKSKQNILSLEALREHFSPLHVTPELSTDNATKVDVDEEPIADAKKVEAATINAALAVRGVTANLDLGAEDMPEFENETDWLDQMIVGVSVERWIEGEFKSARLNWISKKKILYIFMFENNPKPLVYSDQSLIKALREGSIRTVESAPAFDRAVQALIHEAEVSQSELD